MGGSPPPYDSYWLLPSSLRLIGSGSYEEGGERKKGILCFVFIFVDWLRNLWNEISSSVMKRSLRAGV